MTAAIDPSNVAPYIDAYAAGIRAALALGGLSAVVGGAIGWVLLGRRDPLTTIYESRDEREKVAV
jgi:hypothetical protein